MTTQMMDREALKALVREYQTLKAEGAGERGNPRNVDRNKLVRYAQLTQVLTEQKKLRVQMERKRQQQKLSGQQGVQQPQAGMGHVMGGQVCGGGGVQSMGVPHNPQMAYAQGNNNGGNGAMGYGGTGQNHMQPMHPSQPMVNPTSTQGMMNVGMGHVNPMQAPPQYPTNTMQQSGYNPQYKNHGPPAGQGGAPYAQSQPSHPGVHQMPHMAQQQYAAGNGGMGSAGAPGPGGMAQPGSQPQNLFMQSDLSRLQTQIDSFKKMSARHDNYVHQMGANSAARGGNGFTSASPNASGGTSNPMATGAPRQDAPNMVPTSTYQTPAQNQTWKLAQSSATPNSVGGTNPGMVKSMYGNSSFANKTQTMAGNPNANVLVKGGNHGQTATSNAANLKAANSQVNSKATPTNNSKAAISKVATSPGKYAGKQNKQIYHGATPQPHAQQMSPYKPAGALFPTVQAADPQKCKEELLVHQRNLRKIETEHMQAPGPHWRTTKNGLLYISRMNSIARPGHPHLPYGNDMPSFLSVLRHDEKFAPRGNLFDIGQLRKGFFERAKRKRVDRITALRARLEGANDDLSREQRELLETEALALSLAKKQRLLRQDVIQYHAKLEKAVRDREYLDLYTWIPTVEAWSHRCEDKECKASRPQPRKHIRKELQLLAQELRLPALHSEHSRRVEFKRFRDALVVHQKDFQRFHKAKEALTKKTATAVRDHLERRLREAEREVERKEKDRIRALKANDMEAYAKLVEETKNERLTYLLKQTDHYLKDIADLVKSHQSGTTNYAPTHGDDDTDADKYVNEIGMYMLRENITRQPNGLKGGDLKEYQLKGLEWMISLYNNKLNGILADEMGLGKTIQTISLIVHLIEEKSNKGPFFVVVPLSTMSNWSNEFIKWAPSCNVVVYKGSPARRKDLQKNEIGSDKFNVVLTTFEYVMKDKHFLKKIKWQYIIVDEGHRLKNAQSKFAQILGNVYESRNRLLLTGTPLQNNLPELWALLNFLLPTIFNSVENFEQWFNKPLANLQGENQELNTEERMLIINRLHQVLRPFLLRRVKSSVMDQLPEKQEKVIRCNLSAWQKIVYKQLFEKGTAIMNPTKGKARSSGTNLSNIVMQLRKVCNHPYLFLDEDLQPEMSEELVRCSGKFELLDRMLPKLKAAGHRILMFSQMTKVMDLLESYCLMRGYWCLRLDGQTTPEDREQRMFRFNAPDSPHFIFLLSTRAGGLGLNLATADTVILFDRDWNPMMDAQAQDRAHRIGQKNEVRVFTLLTNTPIEEKILAKANQKQHMSKMVVEAGGFNNKSKESDRRQMIQDLMGKDIEEDDDGGIADDDHLNELMAVTEQEFNLYQRIDHEKKEREMIALEAKLGHAGLLKDGNACLTTNDWEEVKSTFIQPSLKGGGDLETDDKENYTDGKDDHGGEGDGKDEIPAGNASQFPLVIKALDKKKDPKKKSRIRLVFNEEDAKAVFDSMVHAPNQRAIVFHYESPTRLMTREEVPEWVKRSEEINQMDPEELRQAELEEYGSGKRKRKEVTYADNLTDRQFMRIVEKEEDINAAIIKKQEQGKKRAAKLAEEKSSSSSVDGKGVVAAKGPRAYEDASKADAGRRSRSTSPPLSAGKSAVVKGGKSSRDKKRKISVVYRKMEEENRTERGGGSGEESDSSDPKVDELTEFKNKLNAELKIIHIAVQNNCTYPGTEVKRCASFEVLPDRTLFRDYYRTIKKPIALAQMEAKMDKKFYKDYKEYRADFKRMVSNCKKYNEENSTIVSDAVILLEEMERLLEELIQKSPELIKAPIKPSKKRKR